MKVINNKRYEVRDPLYAFIEIPSEFIPIVDHKLVQRLRWVNQLPLEQLVYPSAVHSRFEHSLGVMYLAMFAAKNLLDNTAKILKITSNSEIKKIKKEFNSFLKNKDEVILSAGLSGLMHDIGHAPFSHTFEMACKYFNKKLNYNHEEVGYILA